MRLGCKLYVSTCHGIQDTTEELHVCVVQVLEVLQKASQAVRVTWKTDDLDKENEEPMPAAGEAE